MSSSNPGPLEWWLLKWVIAPVALLYLTWTLASIEFMKYKCQQIAEELGYIESSYIPTRSRTGEECICKMKRNPDGTIDENAMLVIDLDMWKRKRKPASTSDCPPTASQPQAHRPGNR
ncbi:MAG: hypothetical protein WCJ02_10765 [bacterium]